MGRVVDSMVPVMDVDSRLVERACYVRDQIPAGGLFAGTTWRVAPAAFPLSGDLVGRLEMLGGELLAFYRTCNLMYRHSVTGKLPRWIADYLDAGKPRELVELSRRDRFKSHLPRVIRPDVILGEDGFFITELDSVPGGIGLTAWLGKAYGELGDSVVGGAHGMLEGFAAAMQLDERPMVALVSDEAGTYRPEMQWLGNQLGFGVMRPGEHVVSDKRETVYRFFELFDLPQLPTTGLLFEAAAQGRVMLTPPVKPQLEEKMLFAFLWMDQLRPFWREHLGESTLDALRKVMPYTWILDPTPLPPHAVIPGLGIHHWRELAKFSQRQRELVLKISGFHEHAWGSRGVYVGHDLPSGEWAGAIDRALDSFATHPFILQRFEKSRVVDAEYYDTDSDAVREFKGRVRLCPYYFVVGDTAKLGGILATVCPSDKKILHGMTDAVMAPCCVGG
jgi:hypothetical protein